MSIGSMPWIMLRNCRQTLKNWRSRRRPTCLSRTRSGSCLPRISLLWSRRLWRLKGSRLKGSRGLKGFLGKVSIRSSIMLMSVSLISSRWWSMTARLSGARVWAIEVKVNYLIKICRRPQRQIRVRPQQTPVDILPTWHGKDPILIRQRWGPLTRASNPTFTQSPQESFLPPQEPLHKALSHHLIFPPRHLRRDPTEILHSKKTVDRLYTEDQIVCYFITIT